MSSEFRKQISLDKEKAAAVVGRVRHLMGLTRLSQAQFAKKIGLDPANISKYINGHLPITDNLINRIVVNTGVSREWLRDGIGLPFDKIMWLLRLSPEWSPVFRCFSSVRSLSMISLCSPVSRSLTARLPRKM